jgi:thioredoxin 2
LASFLPHVFSAVRKFILAAKGKVKMQIVCAHCLALNRVPAERVVDHPVCGKCKQALLPGKPIELTDTTFHKVTNRTDVPIIVDFWAPWCGPCRMMAPAFQQAAAQLTPQILLAKLNTEEFPQSASQFGISGIPTMIALQHGKEIGRQTGALGLSQIVNWGRSFTLH